MEFENKFASKGVAGAGLGLGIAGTALGVLNGGLGNILGTGWNNCGSPDANIYKDQKSLALYQYIDGQLKDIRSTLCDQAVHNQKTEDSFALARQDIAAVKSDLTAKINLEAERRCCGDNAIVRYVNATFYPKMVADVTTGTTTTAQTLYDPLPDCGCCNK